MTWMEIAEIGVTKGFELLDTIIKIGLGAWIAGYVAKKIAQSSQEHEIKKEYFIRRQNLIEQVSEEIEEIYMFFFNLCIYYRGYIDGYNPKISPSQNALDKKSEDLNIIGEHLRKLHVLEGRLILAGIEDGAKCLEQFRHLATDVNNFYNLEPPTVTEKEVGDKSSLLLGKRNEFLSLVGVSYREIK